MIKILIILTMTLSGCSFFNVKQETSDIDTKTITQISKDYKISSNDILEISVYQEEDLTKTARVSTNGYITYPLLGQVKVSGLTVGEVEEKITRQLEKDFLVNPQVSIFIKEYHSKSISVLGAVKKPGSYKIPQEKSLNIMEAISIAGGFNDVASKGKVKIIRMEDGKEKNITVDVKGITKNDKKAKNIILKPNDIIFIPETIF
ncbi:MAG: polysaccharide biosynthesis/export family protein [Atribacterota bacterium]